MYVTSTAAEILGVARVVLETTLASGETIADLARGRGLDVDAVTEAVVDSEIADIEVLAVIAGFSADDVMLFVNEVRDYVVAFVNGGEETANQQFDHVPVLAAA